MRGRLGHRLRRALPALLVWAAAACESFATGQLDVVHCDAEGVIGPPACPDGLACQGGACTPDPLGAPCVTDSDCAAVEFCLDPATFQGAGPSRCSRPCCTSDDCDPDPGAVCWVPPVGGGAFCRPAVEIGRAAGGTLEPLAPCDADSACRSGRCVEHQCADACCSDTPCAPEGICRADGPPRLDGPGFACGPPPGPAPRYTACNDDADCASGLCLDFGEKQPRCSAPCCSSAECEELPGGLPVRCVMLPGIHAGVRACWIDAGTETGLGAVGDPCSVAADCRGGMCLSLGGRQQCTDLCCSDASCGEQATMACRPSIVDDAWALRCGPK